MARVQVYVSDEVSEKIRVIAEKRRAEGARDKDVSFSSIASMLSNPSLEASFSTACRWFVS